MSQDRKTPTSKPVVAETPFGKTASGKEVRLYTVTNSQGLEMQLTDYGATMVSLKTPDRHGKLANIILTCPDIGAYEKCKSYFGCVAGRYCNRIAKGKFKLNGKEYTLAVNNGPNHLHGGNVGFDKVVWQAEPISGDKSAGVRFTYKSPDGDEGYPGNVTVVAGYMLSDENTILIDLYAETDADTHVNLTNHNYWNLEGAEAGTILHHELKVNADKYLPVDDTMIPTGELAPVANTPFDFHDFVDVGKRIGSLLNTPAKGYDHCFTLNLKDQSLSLAATLRDPVSGRTMMISTNQPGLQFYSGNFLDGTAGSGGYKQNGALCLETQFFPDTPNRPEFPSSLLKPGKRYNSQTLLEFDVVK